ncbi:MAG: hypothetical protein OCD02_11870 [Spirochaetaceae bacterium]
MKKNYKKLNREEMLSLLQNLTNFNRTEGLESRFIEYRAFVICRLLFSTGLKVCDISKLNFLDFDFKKNHISIENNIYKLNRYTTNILSRFANKRELLISTKLQEDNCLFFGEINTVLKKQVDKVLSRISGYTVDSSCFSSFDNNLRDSLLVGFN